MPSAPAPPRGHPARCFKCLNFAVARRGGRQGPGPEGAPSAGASLCQHQASHTGAEHRTPALSTARRHQAVHAGTKRHTPAPSFARRHRAPHAGTEHRAQARSTAGRHRAPRGDTKHRVPAPSFAHRPRCCTPAPEHRPLAPPEHRTLAPERCCAGTGASPRRVARRHHRHASAAVSIAPSAPTHRSRRAHEEEPGGGPVPRRDVTAPRKGTWGPSGSDPAAPRRGQCLRAGDPARGTRRLAGAGEGPDASRKVTARPRGHRREATEGWPKATAATPWGTPWTADDES